MSSDDLAYLTGVMGGNVNVAKAALKAAADVNGTQGLPCVPIVMATIGNQARMVNFLLERGADPDMPVTKELPHPSPLSEIAAAMAGERALHIAARSGSLEIVRLLLKRSADPNVADSRGYTPLFATCENLNRRLLHGGPGFCCSATVNMLLEAGADETARDSKGRTPLDVIRLGVGRDDVPRMDRGKRVAVRRMLQRGPAYRARSWAWPCDAEEVDVGGSGDDGNTAAAAAAAAAAGGGGDDAVLSSPPAEKTPPAISGVRIFRPKEENSRKLFARLVGRYCAKD